MFSNVWDVRLDISVVSKHINLNGLSVHVKTEKWKNRLIHWYGLTDLNKTMRKKCGRKKAKDRQQIKFCRSHLTRSIFNYFERRFFQSGQVNIIVFFI